MGRARRETLAGGGVRRGRTATAVGVRFQPAFTLAQPPLLAGSFVNALPSGARRRRQESRRVLAVGIGRRAGAGGFSGGWGGGWR